MAARVLKHARGCSTGNTPAEGLKQIHGPIQLMITLKLILIKLLVATLAGTVIMALL